MIFLVAVMGKNILKVDPVALGCDDLKPGIDDLHEDNEFEWDQKDLEGGSLAKVLSEKSEDDLEPDGSSDDDDF